MLLVSEPSALRWAIRIVNAALVCLGCFLSYRVANDIAAALDEPPIEETTSVADARVTSRPRVGNDVEVILSRNLFAAKSTVLDEPSPPPAPPPPPPKPELKLKLGLLGTIASPSAELRSATVWDAHRRESVVVEEGDELAGGLASVERIERGLVVISSETGATQDLVMDEDGKYRPPSRPPLRKKRSKRISRHRRARRSR